MHPQFLDMETTPVDNYTIDDVKKETKAVAEVKKTEPVHLIVFKLGGEEYALRIDQVKEVVLTPRIAKVPQTPAFLKGVANIRGNIIAIIDLESKFSLSSAQQKSEETSNYTLVIESDEFKVGVLVHEVPNTLTVDASDIDNSSQIIQFSSLKEECIDGIAKVDDRMIIQINILELMKTDELKTYATQEFIK